MPSAEIKSHAGTVPFTEKQAEAPEELAARRLRKTGLLGAPIQKARGNKFMHATIITRLRGLCGGRDRAGRVGVVGCDLDEMLVWRASVSPFTICRTLGGTVKSL